MSKFSVIITKDSQDLLKDCKTRAEKIEAFTKFSEEAFAKIIPNLNGMKVTFTQPILAIIHLEGTKEQVEFVENYLKENNLGTITCIDGIELKLIQ